MNEPIRAVPVGEDGLLPPQSIEAERAVLGALLLQPDLLDQVSGKLTPDAFYLGTHQLVYRAMVALAAKSLPCDLMQVAGYLEQKKQLEKAGGRSALAGLLDGVFTSANLDLHAALVLEKYRRRRLGKLGSKLVQLQHDPGELEAVLAAAEAELFALMADKQDGGLVPLADVAGEVYNEIESRTVSGEVPGQRTGFMRLDDMLNGGLQPSDLVIVAGRPSMGKTAFSLTVANTIASSGKAVAVFSLEMDDKQLAYRLFASEAGIESGLLKKGLVGPRQMESLAVALGELGERPMWIDDSFCPSFAHIRSQCRRLAARQGGLGLVFIDYLQLMDDNSNGGGSNRVIQLGVLTRQLKMLARDLQCPVLVLSQLSRGVESRTNKRPMMSDLRESGSIEQDSDLIMMLYREEYYDPETPDKGIAEVIITKNRNGPTGTAKLLFEPALNRFHNLQEDA